MMATLLIPSPTQPRLPGLSRVAALPTPDASQSAHRQAASALQAGLDAVPG